MSECCICLEPLDDHRKALVTIPCGPHAFHYACYHQWRSKTIACPLCRSLDKTPVIEEDKDDRCYTAVAMMTYAAFAWTMGVITGIHVT
jgi:hypothetical protein